MWKRKELKKNAKELVKKNYWTMVVLCFVIAIFTGEFGSSVTGIWQGDDSVSPNYIISKSDSIIEEKIGKEKLDEINQKEEKIKNVEEKITGGQTKAINTLNANLNSVTRSQKYIYRIWDAIALFYTNQSVLGIGYIIFAIIALVYLIIIAEPLQVAEKRYFLKAQKDGKSKINEIKEVFRKNNWSNVAKTMLFKNIYNLLWFLTIIGGFIKIYEYRMIPYLLADNPKIKRKEAFTYSKNMMQGNKWKTFILDLSFILWEIGSLFTFGLLNVLYVNPYKVATSAELYKILKKENNIEFEENSSI